jgi:DNA-binding NtrC family response regulator
MCRRVREAQGHAGPGCTSVQAALAQLEAEDAELLVVDYKMPELNGLDFVQRAWELRPGLRVVMITAHGTREVINRATRTGVQTVVLKPFTPSELEGRGARDGPTRAAGHGPPNDLAHRRRALASKRRSHIATPSHTAGVERQMNPST